MTPRLVGGGNVVHDVLEFLREDRGPLHSRVGKTRCGLLMPTWDVETWGRKQPRSCKTCEARR